MDGGRTCQLQENLGTANGSAGRGNRRGQGCLRSEVPCPLRDTTMTPTAERGRRHLGTRITVTLLVGGAMGLTAVIPSCIGHPDSSAFLVTPMRDEQQSACSPEASRAIAILEAGLLNCQKLAGYTGELTVASRDGSGNTKPASTLAFAYRRNPLSIAIQWTRNPDRIDRLLYVPEAHDGKILVRPTGAVRVVFSRLELDPEGDLAQSGDFSIDDFGFEAVLERLLNEFRHVGEDTQVTLAWCGDRHPDVPATITKTDSAVRLSVRLHPTLLVPLYVEKTSNNGDLLFRCSYERIEFDPGLEDADFEPELYDL